MNELALEELRHAEWLKNLKVEEKADYDPTNEALSFAKAQEWGGRIPIGLIYSEERPTFEE